MKIAVLGYSGAGKSTFARELCLALDTPVLHLDRVQFMPNWEERPLEEALPMVEDFLQNPHWIIDGSYKKFFQARRLAEADRIYILNFPRIVCFFYAFSRYLKHRGKTRSDMADDCIEKFDMEFISWLLWEGRTNARAEDFKEIENKYPQKTIILKNRRALNKELLFYQKSLGDKTSTKA